MPLVHATDPPAPPPPPAVPITHADLEACPVCRKAAIPGCTTCGRNACLERLGREELARRRRRNEQP